MNYNSFRQHFDKHLLLNLTDIRNSFPDFDQRRLFEWQKKGYIRKLINKCYIFSDRVYTDNEINFIANQIYSPSYLSLEYALQYYSLIPETVYVKTSITTRRTYHIQNNLGDFSYHRVKHQAFFGYRLVSIEGVNFRLAEPEKAILDLIYLRADIKDANDFEELRINQEVFLNKIDKDKLHQYALRFDQKNILTKIENLLSIINK